MLDSADDILPAALRYLGLDPNSTREADLKKAGDLVMTIRPLVRKFHSSEYLNALATGEICFAVGFSGDVKQAQKRAAEAKNGIEIAYSIPNEGAQLWFDNLAIPRDAKNVAEAHEFINFLQTPEIAAPQLEFHLLRQRQSREPEIHRQGNPGGPDHLSGCRHDDQKLYTVNAHDAQTVRLLNRIVDPDQDRAVGRWTVVAWITASGGAATATDPGCSRTQASITLAIGLGGAGDVDLALGVAHRLDRVGDLDPELVAVGQADHAHAMDRAVEMARELRQQRRRLADAAEERDVDAARIVLIDQHAGLAAAFERARQADRRVESRRHQRAHAARPQFDDGVGDRRGCWGRGTASVLSTP